MILQKIYIAYTSTIFINIPIRGLLYIHKCLTSAKKKGKKNELHNSLHTQNFNLNDKQKKIKIKNSNQIFTQRITFFFYIHILSCLMLYHDIKRVVI